MNLNPIATNQGIQLTQHEIKSHLKQMNVNYIKANENEPQRSSLTVLLNERKKDNNKANMIIEGVINDCRNERKKLSALIKRRRQTLVAERIKDNGQIEEKQKVDRLNNDIIPQLSTSSTTVPNKRYSIFKVPNRKPMISERTEEECIKVNEDSNGVLLGNKDKVNKQIELKQIIIMNTSHEPSTEKQPYDKIIVSVNNSFQQDGLNESSNNSTSLNQGVKHIEVHAKSDNDNAPVKEFLFNNIAQSQNINEEKRIMIETLDENDHNTNTNNYNDINNNSIYCDEPIDNQFNYYTPKNEQMIINQLKNVSINDLNPYTNIDNALIVEEQPFKLLYYGLGIGGVLIGIYYCMKGNKMLISQIQANSNSNTSNDTSLIDLLIESFNTGLINILRKPISYLIQFLSQCLTSIGTSIFIDNIKLTVAFTFFLLAAYLIWKEHSNRKLIQCIFNHIKEDLKHMHDSNKDNNNDLTAGISESDIIKEYSHQCNYSEASFNRLIMPKLRHLRAKDDKIKEFEDMINHKTHRIWQWSNDDE